MKMILVLILFAPFLVWATEIDQSVYLPCSKTSRCIEIAYEDMASSSNKAQSHSLNSSRQNPSTHSQIRVPKKEHPGANKYVGIALAVIVGLVIVAIAFSRRDLPKE